MFEIVTCNTCTSLCMSVNVGCHEYSVCMVYKTNNNACMHTWLVYMTLPLTNLIHNPF